MSMQSKKSRMIRAIAIALVVAMLSPVLLACSVVNSNPVIIRVGDVEIYYSEFTSLASTYQSSYSSYLDFTDPADLVTFQDLIFDNLRQYAILLYQAQQNNLELDAETQKEVDQEVADEMQSLTDSYVKKIKDDEETTDAKLQAKGYSLTAEDEASVPEKLDEAFEKAMDEFRSQAKSNDPTLSDDDEEALDAAAQELFEAELATKEQTEEQYMEELEATVRHEMLFNKHAQKEGLEDRDEYITGTLKMTVEEYEAEVRATAIDNALVEMMEENIRAEITLGENDAKEWYDEQVKELTEKYAEDTSGYYSAANTYNSAGEDDIVVRPLVVPEGYIQVKHILLATPNPSATPTAKPVPTSAPTGTPATTGEPTTDDPATTGEPTTDAPTTGEPTTTETPAATEPAPTDAPVATEPATEAPATTGEPTTEEPVTTGEPTTEEPATTGEPTTEAPATTDPEETKKPDASATPQPTTTVPQELIDEVQNAINAIDPEADKLEAFNALIETYNDDPGMKSEPYSEIGYLVSESIEDQYLAGFADAALALENIGDISGPVITTAGVHFIQLIAFVEPETVPFEEAQEEIEAFVLDEKQTKHFNEQIDKWVAELPITEYRQRIRNYSPNTLSNSLTIG